MREPRLPQLPTLTELLDHPRVRSVVGRINQSTLAQRATGYLEELRESLAARTGWSEAPSLSHLAERFARRLAGEPTLPGAAINATGIVVGHPVWSPPIADDALLAFTQSAGEYSQRVANEAALEQELRALAGAEDAIVLSDFEAAVAACLAAAGGDAVWLGDDAEVDGASSWLNFDWREAARRSGVVVRPRAPCRVGDDWLGSTSVRAIVVAPEQSLLADDPSASAGGRLAARRNASSSSPWIIDAAPFAGLIDPASFGLASVPTLQARLAQGVDAVVVDGAGLLGGPTCGLVVGRRELVERVRGLPIATWARAPGLQLQLLHATLQAVRKKSVAEAHFVLPCWQLLSAPLDNRRQRAERMAQQAAAALASANVRAVAVPTPWLQCGPARLTSDDWVLELQTSPSQSESWRRRLLEGGSPVAATVEGESLRIALRSVFPRWDLQVVAAVNSLG